jgi:type IV secretory pathway TraG/TraD family ATPase VirD4
VNPFLDPAPPSAPSVLLGRRADGTPLRSTPLRPITVIGPTGSGKTRWFAAPTMVDWPGPAVVVSVKADLLAAAYAARLERGPVWVLDPEDALGGRFPTARFDLASWTTSLQDAQDVAALLIDAGGTGGLRDDRFWYQLAQTWTAPVLFAGARAGLRFDEIVDVVLEDRSVRAEALVAETGDPIAMRMLRSVFGLEDRARTGVLATVAQSLRVFNRPGVLAATAVEDFAVDDVLDRDCTLAMTLPGFRMREVAPLFATVLTRIWERLQARAARGTTSERPLLVLVDEAAHVAGVTEHLLEWVTTARGLGVQLVTLWQDVTQLVSHYGQECSTMINNTGSALFLDPGCDPDGADYLARLRRAAWPPERARAARPERRNLAFHGGRCDVVSLPGEPSLAPARRRR